MTRVERSNTLIATLVSLILGSASSGCKSDDPPSHKNTPMAGASASAPMTKDTTAPKDKLQKTTSSHPNTRTDITDLAGQAIRVAIGDIDGDGKSELVLVHDDRIRIVRPTGQILAEAPVSAGIQVLRTADLDGDGRDEVIAGWGRTKDHPNATTRITVHRLENDTLTEELVAAPTTTRQDMASIVATGKNTLTIAYFDSKYVVNISRATRTNKIWKLETLATPRMATSLAWGDVDGNGSPELVVGRVYGETQGGDGDAFILKADGTRTIIPTLRGVRGLAIADMDGDGKSEVYLGDGWHQDYGKIAKGLLSQALWSKGSFQKQTIEDTPGQYTLWDIIPADVKGDGHKELITRGSSYVRAFRLREGRWQSHTLAGTSRDIAVGPLDDSPGDDVVVLGNRCVIINLREAVWSDIET